MLADALLLSIRPFSFGGQQTATVLVKIILRENQLERRNIAFARVFQRVGRSTCNLKGVVADNSLQVVRSGVDRLVRKISPHFDLPNYPARKILNFDDYYVSGPGNVNRLPILR